MTATETATTANPATVDAKPYFEQQLEELLEDPDCREVYEQVGVELAFVDGLMKAVINRSRELEISTKDLAERSCSAERSVRRLLAGHPEKVDFCTVIAVAAALGIRMSVQAPDDQPAEQTVAAAS